MPPERIQSIAILGSGGTAAWLAAAALARLLKRDFCQIRVVEPPRADAGPFSEVALPSFHRLNALLGINENDLLQKTRGTFRLGAQFADWGRPGDRYFHTFGPIGAKLDAVPFHHYWLRLRQTGDPTRVEDYSAATVAARTERFARPLSERHSVLSHYSYGHHFQAGLLAAYLREYAQAHGVARLVRNVVTLQRREDGFIEALQLDDGSRLSADLYVDCTGRRAGGAEWQDWRHWLPCDRTVAVSYADQSDAKPYAESAAKESGWRWRIPLQHCVDSGYAYSSRHISDDEAAASLLSELPGDALADPHVLALSAGRPAKFWDKNRIALNAGVLEPLESTSLHLVQTGITRLVTLFPVRGFSPGDIEEYNRLTGMEHERIRDFLILHFKATQRGDSPFWEHCRHMDIPDSLRAKIELFQSCGRIAMFDEEHFGEDSWISLFLGQNLGPRDYDPLADVLELDEVRAALLRMRSMIADAVATLPTHARFLGEQCA